jgi:hypothetical protein
MWSELLSMGARIAPLSDLRPPCAYNRSQFSASFSTTVAELTDELRHMQAKNVIIELDLDEKQIRLDGMPRADARIGSPAVVISFQSKHGDLRYATGEFDRWQDNVRAIARSLNALRAVDRYGVSKRGEQYRGWKALPPSSDPADNIATPEQARKFLDEHGGSFEQAAKRLHPDVPETGDEALFRAAVVARDLLAA